MKEERDSAIDPRIEKAVDAVKDIVTSYQLDTQSISSVMDNQDRLACSLFWLAELQAKLKYHYNIRYLNRKIEYNKKKQGFMQEGLSGVKADTESEVAIKEHRREEIEAETACYQCEILIQQGNRVLSAMQQRISNLKHEQKTIPLTQ